MQSHLKNHSYTSPALPDRSGQIGLEISICHYLKLTLLNLNNYLPVHIAKIKKMNSIYQYQKRADIKHIEHNIAPCRGRGGVYQSVKPWYWNFVQMKSVKNHTFEP